MPLSGLADEIEFKVFRSHVKIPLIFLVPLAFLVTLYAVVYLGANSAWFRAELSQILHEQLEGQFEFDALAVDPTLTRVHVFGGSLKTPEGEPVIDVEEVHATLNPLVLLAGRLSVADARVRGAHVRTIFDDSGTMGLFKALGMTGEKEDKPKKEGGLSVEFAAIEIIDSKYTFERDGLKFDVPSVNVVDASVAIEPQTILMGIDYLKLPKINFHFDHEFIRMSEERGDWEFSVEDAEMRNWRWANDGFRVESVSMFSHGVHLQAQGRMNFPRGDGPDTPTMVYDASATASVAFWSPLAQYFIGDAVHFSVPQFDVAVRGTLKKIDGGAELYADKIESAGLHFEEVRGRVELHNEWVLMHDVSADVHGGKIVVPKAYVNIFEVRYGAAGHFWNVNPRSLLQDFDVDLSFLDGKAKGGFQVDGAVPFFPEEPSPTDPYRMRDFAARKLADLKVTEDWVLQRANRELVPAARATIKKGGTTWVNFARVVVPQGKVMLDGEPVWVEDLRLAYPTMTFEAGPDGRPVRITSEISDVGPWGALYGLDGLEGAVDVKLDFTGPLATPQAMMTMSNKGGPIRFPGTKIAADDLRLRVELDRGRLRFHEAQLATRVGGASLSGWMDVLDPPTPGILQKGKYDSVFALRRIQPAHLEFKADAIDIGAFNRLTGAIQMPGVGRVPVSGALSAEGELRGTLQKPEVDLVAGLNRASVFGQSIPSAYLKAGMRDLPEHGRSIVVDEFVMDAAKAGAFRGSGRYGLDRKYAFNLEGAGTQFESIVPMKLLPEEMRPEGTLALSLHGAGSLDEPDVSGHLTVGELGVGLRDFGDLFLVLTTVDDTLSIAGTAFPLVTVDAQLPFKPGAPYSVRIGMEQLDLGALVPEFTQTAALSNASATGVIEVSMDQDFANWRARATMSKVEVESIGRSIKNDGPLIIEVENGESLTIEQLRIGSGERYLSARGGVSLAPLVFDLQLDGELDLSILNALRSALPEIFPPALVESSGALVLDATFAGPVDALRANGTMDFSGARFVVRGLEDPIYIGDGTVHFGGDRIFVNEDDPIVGSGLGGVVNLTGNLALRGERRGQLMVHGWSHNMKYRLPDTANITFDTDLRLFAQNILDPATWMVRGDVDILDGIYYRNSSVIEQQVTGRVFGAFDRRTTRFEASIFEQVPMLSKIGFDVALRARDGFKVQNQIERLDLDLELRVDLRLRDTLVDPNITGDVEVISGQVGFQGEQFDVRSGTVRFAGEMGNPWVDVIAGADIRNRCRDQAFGDEFQTDLTLSGDLGATREQYYHIMLHLNGYADNLDVQFDSNPYADQRDVLSLLLSGCTVDQLTASSASGPTLEIALGPLLGRIEKEIQDVVKVNEFTIMPGVERTQVRIGDRLSQRLSWNFQLDTGMSEAAGGQRYQLEYKLSDRWAVELSERSKTESNNFLLDLKLKYRLPLN